jgi:hypothetical protein
MSFLCLDQQPAAVARGIILTITSLYGLGFSPGSGGHRDGRFDYLVEI